MFATLFIVILITFIGVGLPDSVLGTAWPVMYREFGLPISVAGYISAVVSVGTIISSLLSTFFIRKLGTGLLTALSTLLTALALLGFAFTKHPFFFFLLALPLGLGAGAIDTALNNFVALHYSAGQMSFLHCFYGLGVAASPFIMSLALGNSENWRKGYFVVALLQLFLAFVAFIALPLWKKAEKREESEEEETRYSLLEVLKNSAARKSSFTFFASCALELTAGGWCSSFFVNSKGVPADKAALITVLFYAGLTIGRFLSGVLAGKLGRRRILRISSLYLLPAALFVFALPLWTWLAAVGLFFIGLGIGPVYPNLMHLTPKFFGNELSQSVIALQQAATYIGILIMPSLFGILADLFSTALFPFFLIAMFLLYAFTLLALLREIKAKKKGR